MSYPLPPTPPGVDDDAWASAVERIREHCGWHIAPEVTETVTIDGPGGSVVALPTLRLTDLVSITNDGATVVEPEWSRSGVVRTYRWTWKMRGVVAEMTHGFEQWPYELERVAAELAATTSAPAGVRQVSSGPHQVTFEPGLTLAQAEILGRYQLPFLQ